jgi:hypothetical protein
MARYGSAVPSWMTARFISTCSKCGKRITKGERIFYYPSSRSAQCSREECGFQSSRDYAAACFDEQNCVW